MELSKENQPNDPAMFLRYFLTNRKYRKGARAGLGGFFCSAANAR
jgi:hypothetical protein